MRIDKNQTPPSAEELFGDLGKIVRKEHAKYHDTLQGSQQTTAGKVKSLEKPFHSPEEK